MHVVIIDARTLKKNRFLMMQSAIHDYCTGFVISPFDVTVTTNSTADFQCQVNLPSSQYTWIVDGNPLNSLSPPDGISLSISNEVQIMSIFSEESRNMTTVVCRVTLANDTVIRSEEATLFIQGKDYPA